MLAVAGGGHARVRVFTVPGGEEWPIQDNGADGSVKGSFVSVAFSPNGKLLAGGVSVGDGEAHNPRPGFVRVWDVARRAKLRDLPVPDERPVRGVAFAPDGRTLAVAVKASPGIPQPMVLLWDALTGAEVAKPLPLTQASLGPCVAFARTDSLLLVTSHGQAEFRRPNTFAVVQTSTLPDESEASAAALSPDGKVAAVALGTDVITWEPGGPPRGTLRGHTGRILALAFAADGRTLFSGGEDRTVREWTVSGPA